MIRRLVLKDFKSFKDAELELGSLTLLLGTNASGKSNVRDAFRFLHGISRGYTLAEIIGEKWAEGGILQWSGIRGGLREVSHNGSPTFLIEVQVEMDGTRQGPLVYEIEVAIGRDPLSARVVRESLRYRGRRDYIFSTHPDGEALANPDARHLSVRVKKRARGRHPTLPFLNDRPVLTEILNDERVQKTSREPAQRMRSALAGMRFLDLAPEALRRPSIPGQAVLGDRGENLSSVLHEICQDPSRKQLLLQWIQELTPMDAMDLRFDEDLNGRVLLSLVESTGNRTSGNSASEGTLRFLAMIAALLGPDPAGFYFFEELENGIHPTRLALLVELIEQQVSRKRIQLAATTHSPQLLTLLGEGSLEFVSLVYRLRGHSDAEITPLLEIADAKRVIENHDIATLMSAGWLEDAVELTTPQHREDQETGTA